MRVSHFSGMSDHALWNMVSLDLKELISSHSSGYTMMKPSRQEKTWNRTDWILELF